MERIITALEPFLIRFNALSDCVSRFELLQLLPNLNHMVSHRLSPVWLRSEGLYFGSYQDLARPL